MDIPACLPCFCAGLLDVNVCVLELHLYPFIPVSDGFYLLCQPGNLLMEHIEIRWRWYVGYISMSPSSCLKLLVGLLIIALFLGVHASGG